MNQLLLSLTSDTMEELINEVLKSNDKAFYINIPRQQIELKFPNHRQFEGWDKATNEEKREWIRTRLHDSISNLSFNFI